MKLNKVFAGKLTILFWAHFGRDLISPRRTGNFFGPRQEKSLICRPTFFIRPLKGKLTAIIIPIELRIRRPNLKKFAHGIFATTILTYKAKRKQKPLINVIWKYLDVEIPKGHNGSPCICIRPISHHRAFGSIYFSCKHLLHRSVAWAVTLVSAVKKKKFNVSNWISSVFISSKNFFQNLIFRIRSDFGI